MGYEHDGHNNGRGRGHGNKGHDWDEGHGHGGDEKPGRPHIDSIQIFRDGDVTVLMIDGEESRIPGICADVRLSYDGRVTVFLSAILCADRAEVGGIVGS
ncbi:hypothetical protein [Streptomyces sp. 5-10]|uniref:hypothetical protein n=1 Tax=Streptomyces sp. 5-10 TaxID=878925 RepID=UPI00168A4BE9|nr:hypothetical protein [Streptomyces sp. 5-10]MBD3004516.1 hypothetical protein [Streptomyces sp. 5-10]